MLKISIGQVKSQGELGSNRQMNLTYSWSSLMSLSFDDCSSCETLTICRSLSISCLDFFTSLWASICSSNKNVKQLLSRFSLDWFELSCNYKYYNNLLIFFQGHPKFSYPKVSICSLSHKTYTVSNKDSQKLICSFIGCREMPPTIGLAGIHSQIYDDLQLGVLAFFLTLKGCLEPENLEKHCSRPTVFFCLTARHP